MTNRIPFGNRKEMVFKSILVTLLSTAFLAWGQELDLLNCSPEGDICERVECAPALPCEGFVEPKGSRCKCCPVCVTLIDLNEECPKDDSPEEGPVHSVQCKPGLECVNGFCQRNSSYLTACQIDREKRETGALKFPDPFEPKRHLWKPDCDHDGHYKIKQCQHGRCFCVDRKSGQRIFGQEEADLAQNMTCACSHALHERLLSLKLGKREAEWNTYEQEHCTTSGDYEHLQCYKDTCFCVNSQTGVPYGTMVKIKQRELLPCYDPKLHKESYLSRCEKQLFTERRILYDFAQKNIKIMGLIEIDCDPDGAFTRNLCKPEICYCSDRSGKSFGVYKKDRLDGQLDSVMQCQCARDEEDKLENNARYEGLKCDQYGNFAVFQCFDKECFCVDKNGDRITETVDLGVYNVPNIREECLGMLALLGQTNETSNFYYSDLPSDDSFLTFEN